MSHIENEKWIEAAYEHLDGAIADGNLQLAEQIVADTFDQGFAHDSQIMRRTLSEAKAKRVLVKSSYPTI